MNEIEFGKRCQPINKQYYELFGEIPVFYDYNIDRAGYILALEKAVQERIKIDEILEKANMPFEQNDKY